MEHLHSNGTTWETKCHISGILFKELCIRNKFLCFQTDFQVNYEITSAVCNSTNTYKSQYVKTMELETVQPVECEAQFQTLQFQSLRQIPVGEPCVAVMTITNLSPFPLLLEQGVWKLNQLLSSQPMTSQLSGLTLQQGEKANDVVVLTVLECESEQIRTGSYSLKWKRCREFYRL